jgi:hypothetical protein
LVDIDTVKPSIVFEAALLALVAVRNRNEAERSAEQ